MKQLKQIKELLQCVNKKRRKVFFFFDYDGVLVPLQNNPYTSYLSKKVRDKLELLSSSPNKVALVSGRDLKTIKRLTKIKSRKITLVGTHGLEIENLKYKSKKVYTTRHEPELKRIKNVLFRISRNIANGFMENKPYSFTYHIRDSDYRNLIKKLRLALKKFLRSQKLDKKIKILEGKKMVEVMPEKVSKGVAVQKIINEYPGYLYVYFGDDITDISAFKAVKRYGGISVSFNGALNYKADFLVKSQKDINVILSGLLDVEGRQ